MSSIRMSPNQREVISAISDVTNKQEYITSHNGAINVNGSFSITGGATSANQTNGQQLVQIVDAGGEAATVTGGKLDVNATASLAGTALPISGATTAVGVAIVDSSGNQISSFGGGTQYTDGGVPPTHPIGNTIEWSDGSNWQTVSTAKPLPVTATFSPSGTQDINLKQINGNTTSVGNGVAGTGVQRVTIASDNTAFAVNATLSAETTKVIGTVNQGTSPWVVSNGGTFAVQAAQSGTWNITNISGTVSLPTGASTSALQTTGNTSLASIVTNTTGLTVAQGSTTSGQTGQLVQGAVTTAAPTYTTAQTSPLSLDTTGNLRTTTVLGSGTNVIGHVITDTGSTTAVTGTVTISGTVTANAGTNLNTSLLALESGGNLASIKADVDNLNLAQASTTSGQKGNLILAATTTAAPSYTTAQSNPLSLTTGGLLRVDGSGVTQPVSLTSTTITGTVAVTQSTSPWIVAGGGTAGSAATGVVTIQGIASMTKLLVTPDSVALPANQSVNVSQINGVTPLMGNGVTGTGSQRVTIASDNTAFSVNATLSAETTKVIGVVRTADGSGNLLTSTANALDINIKSGSIANTSFAATQATASSLNATVVQGTAAALSAGWPTLNGEAADTTGTFTNATQTTSVTAGSLDGYGNVLISINGTYATATAVFEGSDDGGTTWYGISEADRTDSNVIESGYTSLTNTSRAWQISNPGWDSVRVRSTAVASGTVNVRISPSAAPTSAGASVSIGTALPTGTNVIGHVIADSGSTTAATQATAANLNATVVGTGTFSVQTTSDTPGTGATNLGKAEDAGHTTGDTGVMALGVRNDTLAATTNTTADYTQLTTDQAGIVITAGAPRALKGNPTDTTITSSTTETTVLAAVASTFLDVYGATFTNSSATATKITLRDATAGTIRWIGYVPAGDMRGFMLTLDSAIPQAAVNNNWTVTCGTSVASLDVTLFYVKRV